jgi:hypothetical protein
MPIPQFDFVLETVLPPSIFAALSPRLSTAVAPAFHRRGAAAVRADLLNAAATITVTRARCVDSSARQNPTTKVRTNRSVRSRISARPVPMIYTTTRRRHEPPMSISWSFGKTPIPIFPFSGKAKGEYARLR